MPAAGRSTCSATIPNGPFGCGTDSRPTPAAVRPLAELLAAHGLGVVVPDWNSYNDDNGRADLLHSVQFARERAADTDGLVLVGWSMGGVAAAGLSIHASQYGVRFSRVVCLAGAFMVFDPITGKHPASWLYGGETTPVTLQHGISDDAVPVTASREFAAILDRNQWPVELVELCADHGSIAGPTYDPEADRYSASTDSDTLTVAAEVATRIAAVR